MEFLFEILYLLRGEGTEVRPRDFIYSKVTPGGGGAVRVVPFCGGPVVVVMAPIVVPAALFLSELPCHKPLTGMLPQDKSPPIVK